MNSNGSRQVEYKDEDGRLFARLIPTSAPDSEAAFGVPIGPPDLRVLDLPKRVEVRLNNELYHRRIFTEADIKARRGDVMAALMFAYRVDVDTLLASLASIERG